jgi:hypothetical protein
MRVTRGGTHLRQPVLSTVEAQVPLHCWGLQRPFAGCVAAGAQIAQLCAHHDDAVTPHLAAPNGGYLRTDVDRHEH